MLNRATKRCIGYERNYGALAARAIGAVTTQLKNGIILRPKTSPPLFVAIRQDRCFAAKKIAFVTRNHLILI